MALSLRCAPRYPRFFYPMMDESQYLKLADAIFRTISDAFENVDPDDVDVYTAGDVLTLAFKNGVKCVINTQRPTRQVWLAANAQAWHFSYDAGTSKWDGRQGTRRATGADPTDRETEQRAGRGALT